MHYQKVVKFWSVHFTAETFSSPYENLLTSVYLNLIWFCFRKCDGLKENFEPLLYALLFYLQFIHIEFEQMWEVIGGENSNCIIGLLLLLRITHIHHVVFKLNIPEEDSLALDYKLVLIPFLHTPLSGHKKK